MSYSWASFLFGSSNRIEVLDELDPPGVDTRALAEELSASKATVQRHVRQFLDMGWVVKRDGTYERTPIGDRVLQLSNEYLANMVLLAEYGEAVEPVLNTETPFEMSALSGADVVLSTADRPHAPLSAYRKYALKANPDTIRCVVPVFSELLLDVHLQHAREGTTVELLAPPEPTSHVVDWLRSTSAAGVVDVYETTRETATSIAMVDDMTFVGIHTEETFRACIIADGSGIRQWATQEYNHCRNRASRRFSTRLSEDERKLLPEQGHNY